MDLKDGLEEVSARGKNKKRDILHFRFTYLHPLDPVGIYARYLDGFPTFLGEKNKPTVSLWHFQQYLKHLYLS